MAKKKTTEPRSLTLSAADKLKSLTLSDDMRALAKHKQEQAPGALCEHCPLLSRPMVPGHGTAPITGVCRGVIVGEAPGRNEAKQGRPFVGDSGKLLRSMLLGLTDIDPDTLYLTNTALCHPPANKIPWKAAQCCRPRLIQELQPYLDTPGIPIVAAGVIAGQSLTGITHGSLRGKWYRGGRVLCTWHPAYILRTGEHFSELRHDLRKLAHGHPVKDIPVEHFIADTPELIDAWVDYTIRHCSGQTVCFDLETDQLVYWEHKILCCAFAVEDYIAWVIPGKMIYLSSTSDALNRLFASDVSFMGHNIKYDIKFLKYQLGVNARGEDDSLVAHYIIDETMYHGLKPLLTNYFDIGDYEGELVQKYLRTKGDMYSKVPQEHLMHYNALDVCYNLRLWKVLKAKLERDDLFDMPYRYPLMAALPHMVDMELYGMHCNEEFLLSTSTRMGEGIDELKKQLEDMATGPFNPNSWVQIQKIMYGHFHMPSVRGNFKHQSTCLEARRLIRLELAGRGQNESVAFKWLGLFDQLKSLMKIKSSYVDNLMYGSKKKSRMIGPKGKIHPVCLLYGTETGRVSFRDPAIQTIPRAGTGNALGEVWGKHIRVGYCYAPKGWSIMEVDISQAEMRVACALSGDPYLHKIYANNRDIHTEVATSMYGPDFNKEQRKDCKKFNFAFLYGGTEKSFSVETGMPIEMAKQFVRDYKKLMIGLCEWRDVQLKSLLARGYVETRTKRRRRFPLITNDNRDEARKAALNMPVQGAASDITLITFIKTCEWINSENIDYVKMIAIIHDSVLLEVKDDKIEYAGRYIQQIMKSTGEEWFPEVQWKVDIDTGPDWGHLEGYDAK